jgi:hypothetical protein
MRRMKSAGFELNFYLDAPKALLKVSKHFISTICSLINSTSKLCRIDERLQKGYFRLPALSHLTFSLILLATFRALNFQRQIVEKHGLIQTINKTS